MFWRRCWYGLTVFLLLGCCQLWGAPGDTLRYNIFDKLAAELHSNSINSGQASFPARVKLAERGKDFYKIFGVMKYGCYPGRSCGKWDAPSHIYLSQLSLPEDPRFVSTKIWSGPRKGRRTRFAKGRTPGRGRGGKLPVRQYELARWITPFGAMYKAKDGFEGAVSFDLTDFSLLLRDSVEVTFWLGGFYGHKTEGWQITLDFYYVEGTPIRESLKVEPLPWCGERQYVEMWRWYDPKSRYVPLKGDGTSHPYGLLDEAALEARFRAMEPDFSDEQIRASIRSSDCLAERRDYVLKAHKEAKSLRVRVVQSGGGAYETEEGEICSEFCPRERYLWLDNRLLATTLVWKRCGFVALHPQSGTWLFDRSGWCPSEVVSPVNYDVAVRGGRKYELGFAMESMAVDAERLRKHGRATYSISGNVIHYGEKNFQRDLGIEDVVAPSRAFWHRRYNPICAEPIVILRNNGAELVESVLVRYGVRRSEADTLMRYEWRGSLSFMEQDTVILPGVLDWQRGEGWFEARLEEVNGEGQDDYSLNDLYRTRYVPPSAYADDELKLKIRSNFRPRENWLHVDNMDTGERVFEILEFKLYKKYNLEVPLESGGCYRLILSDEGADPSLSDPNRRAFHQLADGLAFQHRAVDGYGKFEIKNKALRTGKEVKFTPDFGSRILYQFTAQAPGEEAPGEVPGEEVPEEEVPEEEAPKEE